MKKFTYYKNDKINLQLNDSRWLNDIGLIETRWILDVNWLIDHFTYPKWIK